MKVVPCPDTQPAKTARELKNGIYTSVLFPGQYLIVVNKMSWFFGVHVTASENMAAVERRRKDREWVPYNGKLVISND